MILLYGKSRLLKDEALQNLKKEAGFQDSGSEMDCQMFYADRDPVSLAIDFLSTAPFLSSKRLGVLWAVDDLSESDQSLLLKKMKELPRTAILVLETEQTNVKKDAFLKALSEQVKSVACHVPFEKDMPAWIETRAKKRGLTIERSAVLFLLGQLAEDLSGLDHAIECLGLFIHPRQSIKLEDAKNLIQKTSEEDVFRLADFILDGRKKEALMTVDSLYRSGARAPEIVAALGGQLDRYRRAQGARSLGRSVEEIGEELRIPRMVQSHFFSRLDRVPQDKILKMTRELLACDVAYKTGQMDERLSVERFILRT